MSPVLKKRHSKSYVPLFSKRSGLCPATYPIPIHFFCNQKSSSPSETAFPFIHYFIIFIFRTHFLYHVVLYQQKRFLLKLLQMKYHTPTPHHPSTGSKCRGINRMQLLLCVIRFTNHSPKVNHTILRFRCEKALFFGQFLSLNHFLRNHRWKYPSLSSGEMV